MGSVIITLQILPEDPETNLEEISQKVKDIVEKQGGKVINTSIEPFVFGLQKLIIKFLYPEQEFHEEKLINNIENIQGVQSAEIIAVTRSIV